MIENRLELNKKKVYELPRNTIAIRYERLSKGDSIPSFHPDVCLNAFGCIGVREPKETAVQIWIKSDDEELIEFIREFDFESKLQKITNAYKLETWKFKKIILEEFYGIKN